MCVSWKRDGGEERESNVEENRGREAPSRLFFPLGITPAFPITKY